MGLLKAKRDGKLVAYRLDKAAVIVGSGDNCNIRVADMGLVARHCQILKMENGFVLRDMSGDAGTFVNGKKVKEHLLTDRDLIQMGKERFTFSDSAGENTARVAVSVAPGTASVPKAGTQRVAAAPPAAPARSGNTGRIAAPAPKTERAETAGRNTGRMPAPAAAAEGGSRSTQRVNKASTQRTATVQKSTGATKKITARSASAMGYQTERKTFALPSTRKGKLIALGGVAFILALGGTLWMIKSHQIDPEAVKQEMAKELADLRKFKPDQVIEIDAGFERILAEHEPVKKYVMQMYSNIDKEHTKVHQIASDLKKAMKDVKPFLDKYAAIKGKPELKPQAQTLYDECKSLSDSYGNTTIGAQLGDILKDLKVILEDSGPSWQNEIIGLQRDVQVAVKKGDFAGAAKAANDFGTKFDEKQKLELFNKLQDERAMIERQSEAFVKRETEKAQKDLAAEGAKKDEIKKRLEGFKPGLEGYKKALEKLEAAIAGIK